MTRLWPVRRLITIAAVAIVVGAATGRAATDAFHRYTIPGYGTSVALPSSWKTIDYRQILKAGVLDRLARDNPELAGSFAAMAQPNSPIKLFAYDPQIANKFATNANVVIVPLGGQISFSEYARQLVGELRTVASVSQLHSSTVRLPAGRAVRISYRLTVNVRGRSVLVQTLQYGFLNARRSIVVTYSTLPASARFYSGVFTTSAKSIRFG
jgi:hypothetical protein